MRTFLVGLLCVVMLASTSLAAGPPPESCSAKTLTLAQITSLNAVPVTIINAPGSGKALVLTSIQLNQSAGVDWIGTVTSGQGPELAFAYASSDILVTIPQLGMRGIVPVNWLLTDMTFLPSYFDGLNSFRVGENSQQEGSFGSFLEDNQAIVVFLFNPFGGDTSVSGGTRTLSIRVCARALPFPF